ncbi:MAG: ferredoxin--NADP reductase [Betaproteobacteria bacterium]|nr:ferredoxin--NADP reductase [Betaproteobacteria bacterium]NBT75768.1 ferredoxin--NADP reductase [Betaproteobacteria bacterium]NBY14109.1 ferredoxin--NADP reductase [Betaproteobacteria bacterium]NCA16579.1 ferredoxin--NADP reductase [Betaproteobacteria bacterium]NDF04304.1 ferredoxin--NADP reductase [Betaproteobacteria bacterium]
MAKHRQETITEVMHWNESLFSFKTTRDSSFRFRNGHFVMIGLEVEGRPLMRAYSVVSANYEEHLEFLSIKVPDGPLTSRLQHVKVGDLLLVGEKATGTLVIDDLRPGRHLYLFSTGTGLAPFMSIVRDPDTYERFEKVVLIHGVRTVSELAYGDYLRTELPAHEFLGDMVREQLIYYPTVTREAFKHTGRLTTAIETGRLFDDIGLPPLDAEGDRAMICGSPSMLKETAAMLDSRGFLVSPGLGQPGDYVIERAFVER